MDHAVEDVRNNGVLERKRCLPSWMLGMTAADKERSSKNQDDTCTSVGNKEHQQVGQSEHGSDDAEEKLVLPPVKDTIENIIKSARKSNRKIVDNENVAHRHEDASERKKKRMKINTREERHTQKLKKSSKKYACTGYKGAEKLSPAEGGDSTVELTLDDLMSIAEEYVIAESVKDSEKEAGPSKSLSSQSVSSYKIRSEKAHVGMDFVKQGSMTNDGLPTKDMECTAPVSTGNVIEDMLNIFFGPVLSKPQEHKKLEFSEFMPQSNTTSKNLNRETVKGEEASLIKKKGSLKEKVAMLLD